MSPTAKFCDQCGHRVANGATPGASAAVRKRVTAVFADLVGSTGFAERVDPEAARSALAPYFELLRSAVDDHHGTVIKYTGDGMLAVFGVPEMAEDDALRAVAAGVELQRRFRSFADRVLDQHGVDLGLRVGINSGELVIADADADMVGDVLNTAARLEAECAPGHVLVGEATWRLTRSVVTYEVLGEVRVKGKADPVATFQVAGDHAEIADDVTPFVGRTDELELLLGAFAEARDSPVARLVSVIGAPGVGKTRLASELRAATEARSFDLRFERRGSTTFTPIADLLREVTGGNPDGVASLFDGHRERDRLVPVLQSFLGHGSVRTTEESFWATRRLLEHLTADGPIIVVIDDLQWAEPLFWDLLDHLVEWAEAPMLIVALARPELRELRPELSQPGRRVAATIALEGLDPASTRELAIRLLDTEHLPNELLERIPDTTDGNPLFVRELVQMLVDDGTLERDGDGWRLTIDVEAIDVPPTVLSLLATRVERLPDDERRLIELASVIGTEFDRGALTAIAGAQVPAGLGAVIDRLRRRDLIEPSGAWSGDQPVYRFHHVLVRDAAYRRLLKNSRAELHELMGHHVLATDDGEDADVTIAHHFELAVRYRRELGIRNDATAELAALAVGRLHRATDVAIDREDLPSAGGYARRALELVDDTDPVRNELLVLGCEAFLTSGDVAAATPLVRELHEGSPDARLAAWADCFRAQRWSLTDAARLTEAADLADGAARRLAELDDQSGVAKARLVRATCLARLGRVGDCESELDLALGAARTAGDRRRTVAVLGAAPAAALWGPSPVARAGGRCLDVLRLLRITTASPAVEATSVRCQGMLEALRGRFESARDKLEQSRAAARELGLRHGLFETELFAGFVELWADDPEAAIPHLRAAYEGLDRLGLGADAGQAGALLAHALLRQGDIDAADRLATEALEAAGENLKTAMSSRASLAEVRAMQGRGAEARRLLDEALAIAEGTDVVLDHALVLMAARRVAIESGRPDDAADFARRVAAVLDTKGVTLDEQRLTAPTPIGWDASRSSAAPTTPATPRPNFEHHPAAVLVRRVVAAVQAGDRDALEALYVPDLVLEYRDRLDLRPASRSDYLDFAADSGPESHASRADIVATRGDDLCLFRYERERDGVWTTRLVLHGLADGRCDVCIWFGGDAEREAIDALDAEYRRRCGIADDHPIARMWPVLYSTDPALLAPWLADDFEFVDHRPVPFPAGDRHLLVEAMATHDVEVDVEVPCMLRLTTDGGVFQIVERSPDAGVDRTYLAVAVVADGRVRRTETFPADDVDRALARFHELTSDTPPAAARVGAGQSSTSGTEPRSLAAGGPTPNRCWEIAEAVRAAHVERDWKRFDALIHPDFRVTPRRRLSNAHMATAEEFLASQVELATMSEQFTHRATLVASRGEHLQLACHTLTLDANELEFLLVVRSSESHLVEMWTFDGDQLVDAQIQLDRCWFDELGLTDDHPVRRFGHLAYATGSDELIAATLPDVRYGEHRRLSFAGGGLDDFAAMTETMQYVDHVIVPRVHHVSDHSVLYENDVVAADGERSTSVVLLGLSTDGVASIDVYEIDDLDEALAHVDEPEPTVAQAPAVAATSSALEPGRALMNHASGVYQRALAAIESADRAALDDVYTVDFVPTWNDPLDPRPTDRDHFLDWTLDRATHGAAYDSEVVAVRDDELCLIRNTQVVDGKPLTRYTVWGTDGDRCNLVVRLPDDRLDTALDELDDRWAARSGRTGVAGSFQRSRRAFLVPGLDLDELPFADDFETIDHRPLGLGRRDLDEFLASAGFVTPTTFVVPRIFDVTDDLLLYEVQFVRTEDAFLWHAIHIVKYDVDGLVTQNHVFDLDQFDEARALFEQLVAERTSADVG